MCHPILFCKEADALRSAGMPALPTVFYVPRRLAALGIPALDEQAAGWLASDEALQRFAHAAMQFRRAARPARPAILTDHARVVFEGAQGLLLDQDRGAFPYVTRSHTGIRNALNVAAEAGIATLDVTYVTRAYLTRHGAGPLANELPDKPYAGIEDRTNVPNEFQGTLRFAHLDLDLLARTVRTDFADAPACPRHRRAPEPVGKLPRPGR